MCEDIFLFYWLFYKSVNVKTAGLHQTFFNMSLFYSLGTVIQPVKTPAPWFPHLTKKRMKFSTHTLRTGLRGARHHHPECRHCLCWSKLATECLLGLLLPVCTSASLVGCMLTPVFGVLLGFVFCSWANREEVWKIMLNKEKTYLRDKHLMQRHPLLQPKMRAILLDWLMEVGWAFWLTRSIDRF